MILQKDDSGVSKLKNRLTCWGPMAKIEFALKPFANDPARHAMVKMNGKEEYAVFSNGEYLNEPED